MDVIEAMRDRISVREYRDQPVTRELLEQVMEAARWAPSGTNTQPWQVVAVAGEVKERISAQIRERVGAGVPSKADYAYYPEKFVEPYKGRRWRCGMQLYGAIGITIEDKPARMDAMMRNYDFFGAPLGLFFYVDRVMAKGSWVDIGMFIQNVMLAARGFGLETCPQFALAMYPDLVAENAAVPEGHDLVCGLSMGYAEPDAAINQYRTERMEVSEFCRWFE